MHRLHTRTAHSPHLRSAGPRLSWRWLFLLLDFPAATNSRRAISLTKASEHSRTASMMPPSKISNRPRILIRRCSTRVFISPPPTPASTFPALLQSRIKISANRPSRSLKIFYPLTRITSAPSMVLVPFFFRWPARRMIRNFLKNRKLIIKNISSWSPKIPNRITGSVWSTGRSLSGPMAKCVRTTTKRIFASR